MRNITSEDHIVFNYLPFISNCEKLGSHITIKNMLERPECELYRTNVKYI